MELGEGLSLHPGDDGTLPVRLRWVTHVDVPEALAVDGDKVYSVGTELLAFRLADGTPIWECDLDEALQASGGVIVGIEGSDVLRVFAPWEYDLRVERSTGRVISHTPAQGAGPTGDFEPLPAPPPTTFRIIPALEEIVAYKPDGSVAWRLSVDDPFVDPTMPIEVNGAIVCGTSAQHLVVLDLV